MAAFLRVEAEIAGSLPPFDPDNVRESKMEIDFGMEFEEFSCVEYNAALEDLLCSTMVTLLTSTLCSTPLIAGDSYPLHRWLGILA